MKSNRRQFLILTCLAMGVGFATRAFAVKKKKKIKWDGIVGDCVVTCPVCKTQVQETMVPETLKLIYHCPVCLTWLSPKKGDHCIYESYGSVNCPPIQVKKRREKGLPIPSQGEGD
jgi:hypothetical protein